MKAVNQNGVEIKAGDKVKVGDYTGTVLSIYMENMVEVRLNGGVSCQSTYWMELVDEM